LTIGAPASSFPLVLGSSGEDDSEAFDLDFRLGGAGGDFGIPRNARFLKQRTIACYAAFG
jgi:hypothetical protein